MIVGIVGGGQLARMMALAGIPLGIQFRFLSPSSSACAFPLGEALQGDYDNSFLLKRLAEGARVITYEFENVSFEGIKEVSRLCPVHPNPEILFIKQNRLREKQMFLELGIPTVEFRPVENEEQLRKAGEDLGYPLILKSCAYGYDGKGQAVVEKEEDLFFSWEKLGKVPVVAEKFLAFDREVSQVGVRSLTGEEAFYPLSENIHRRGVLRRSRSRPGDPFSEKAREYLQRIFEKFSYAGVLALEFFQVGDELLVNEMAPRVHNTGHWTIEGAETSQFENHLRAILGWPLGSTEPVGFVEMVNCLGEIPDLERISKVPGVHLHIYGKSARPGRKVGHITVRAHNEERLRERVRQLDLLLEEFQERRSVGVGGAH